MTQERRYNWGIAVCFMILSPLLAMPYILYGMYHRKKSAFFLFSLFLGLLAWLQLPISDLFRHTMSFYNNQDRTLADIFSSEEDPDFIIPLANWFLAQCNIPYQYLRLFEVTESFYLLTVIFNYMIEKSPRIYTKKEVFVRFWIMFLLYELIQTTSGVRYGFALYQYIFALHLFINKRSYFWALFFAILSSRIHNSFTFFIPISLLLYFICRSRKITIIVFCIAISIIGIVISRFSYLWESRANWYFDGGASVAGDSFQAMTIYGFILYIAVRLFLLPYIYIAFRYFNSASGWHKIATAWIIFIGVFITNGMMIFRVAFVFAAISPFMILATENYYRLKEKTIRLLLYCGLAITLFNTVNYRTIIIESRYAYILAPIPIILGNQYDPHWILQHIDNNEMLPST